MSRDIHLYNRDVLIKQNLSFLQGKAFMEFGVYHGESMLMWHDLYQKNNLSTIFFGFDSFVGLPQETVDKNTIWDTGYFSTGGIVNSDLSNRVGVKMITGFYDTSLNEETARLLGDLKVGLVHIDCDTYSSTKTVWEWLLKYDLLACGALIVYDDWGAWLEAKCGEYEVGEAKAHQEIVDRYNLSVIDLGKYIVNPSFYEVKLYRYEGS